MRSVLKEVTLVLLTDKWLVYDLMLKVQPHAIPVMDGWKYLMSNQPTVRDLQRNTQFS